MDRTNEFLSALRRAGLTDELMLEIANSKNNRMAKKMLNAIKYDLAASKMVLNFTVDYVNGLSEIIAHDEPGTHHFMPKNEAGISKIVVEIFENSEDIEEEMAREGCRPANAYELAAFEKNNPKSQRQFPIVALSSTWLDCIGHSVLYLKDNNPDNETDYGYFVLSEHPMTWPKDYCFLGVYV